MARYGRDFRGYDRGYGPAPGPGRRPRRRPDPRSPHPGGFDIGPVWGGGSDIGYRPPRVLGGGREPGPPPPPRRYDWWYW